MKKQETRGRKPVYDFSEFKVGDSKRFATYNANITTCARYFCKKHKLNWKFKSYSNADGTVMLVRLG